MGNLDRLSLLSRVTESIEYDYSDSQVLFSINYKITEARSEVANETEQEEKNVDNFLVFLYIFVLYSFVLSPQYLKYETKELIADAQARLDQLEEDYKNLPSFKQEIEINKTTDKWLSSI